VIEGSLVLTNSVDFCSSKNCQVKKSKPDFDTTVCDHNELYCSYILEEALKRVIILGKVEE